MKIITQAHARLQKGFTLIEMLVVIAVIAILASMIFPITKAVTRNKIRARARAELTQLDTAIQTYKTKLGYYPPDNRNNPALNQLYYELLGTTFTPAGKSGTYQTLDGSAQISATDVQSQFGVGGFQNSATANGGDEGPVAVNFFKGISPSQVRDYIDPNGSARIRLLVGPGAWPDNLPQVMKGVANKGLNPWRYNSSGPTNNPTSYDLWIDLIIDGKTNRISNWSREPLINPPY